MKPIKTAHSLHNVFPELAWQDDEWVGETTLDRWHTVGLSIATEASSRPGEPTKEQENAYQHLMKSTPDVVVALTTRLAKYYKRMRPRYLDYLGSKGSRLMPEIKEALDLLQLIDLIHIYIHAESKDGSAYVGFHFDCTWEKEHGLGFIMHRNKVLEVDSADISFSWSAE